MAKSCIFSLFGIFALLFPAFLVYGEGILLDRVVAVVNKEVITWSELYKMMEYEASEQVKAMKAEERAKVFKQNEALFLDKLIDVRLQIQEARNMGQRISQDEVKEAVENIKKKYSMTDKALEDSLKKEGLTFEEYKGRIADQMLVSNIVNQKVRSKILITDENVKKYMEEHQDRGNESESYKLRQIFFRRPKDEADIKAVEEKASLIMQKLQAGEDFSSLAKEYSDDPSAKIGGDLGSVQKKLLAKEFIDVLATMKAGEYSKPFWTDKGLHMIKLDEHIAAQGTDEVKEKIRNKLYEVQFVEKYKSWIKSLRENARIEIRL